MLQQALVNFLDRPQEVLLAALCLILLAAFCMALGTMLITRERAEPKERIVLYTYRKDRK